MLFSFFVFLLFGCLVGSSGCCLVIELFSCLVGSNDYQQVTEQPIKQQKAPKPAKIKICSQKNLASPSISALGRASKLPLLSLNEIVQKHYKTLSLRK